MDITLNASQSAALEAVRSFLVDQAHDGFLLRGSAGTGKTTLIASMVAMLAEMNVTCALLAPTGRAARILGNKMQQQLGKDAIPAATLHGAIYRFDEAVVNEKALDENDPGIRWFFRLRTDAPVVSVLIIDEASMVGDRKSGDHQIQFGSGRLLSDLVQYARLGQGRAPGQSPTRIIFVGDAAQLPPVGQNVSPALAPGYLEHRFGLRVVVRDLVEVVCQAADSAILARAREIRDAIAGNDFRRFALQADAADICQVKPAAVIDTLVAGIREKKSCVAIVHSNREALEFNRAVRARLWGHEQLPVQCGDLLLVNRQSLLHGFNNGDLVKVLGVAEHAERVVMSIRTKRGMRKVELAFRAAAVALRRGDGEITKRDCLLLENQLDSGDRMLNALTQQALLVHFRQRHRDLRPNTPEFLLALQADQHFNALQVKYGYALTCHKAQGGEWDTVAVDFTGRCWLQTSGFFRWTYTAITRAVKQLLVVNPPAFAPARPAQLRALGKAVAAVPSRPEADRDWQRLGFSPVLAPLLPVHRRLRAAWEKQRIHVVSLEHPDGEERYVLRRARQEVTVLYHYDERFRVTAFGMAPGVGADLTLASDALAALRGLEHVRTAPPHEPFVEHFIERLDRATAVSSIRRLGVRDTNCGIRVAFGDGVRQGEIDFHYDGTQCWRRMRPADARQDSGSLCRDVRTLLRATPASANTPHASTGTC